MGETVKTKEKMTGALPGFIISIVIGFAFYFGLKALSGNNAVFDYNNMISGILDSVPKQIAWFFMNFTEAQFYASVFAGIGIILGGIVAWILAKIQNMQDLMSAMEVVPYFRGCWHHSSSPWDWQFLYFVILMDLQIHP